MALFVVEESGETNAVTQVHKDRLKAYREADYMADHLTKGEREKSDRCGCYVNNVRVYEVEDEKDVEEYFNCGNVVYDPFEPFTAYFVLMTRDLEDVAELEDRVDFDVAKRNFYEIATCGINDYVPGIFPNTHPADFYMAEENAYKQAEVVQSAVALVECTVSPRSKGVSCERYRIQTADRESGAWERCRYGWEERAVESIENSNKCGLPPKRNERVSEK